MLDKDIKIIEIKTNRIVNSLFVWNHKTKSYWQAIEFADFREYSDQDNARDIDFIKSINEWKIIIRLNELEKDLKLYFILDISDSLFYDIDNRKKIDLLYEIMYLIWFSAIKNWDKVGAFLCNNDNNIFCMAKKWKKNLGNIISKITTLNTIDTSIFQKIKKQIFSNNIINNYFDESIKKFNNFKIQDSLVCLITDKTEINNKQLKILWLKNDLIVCNIFNSIENKLEWTWIKRFKHNNKELYINLDDDKKITNYNNLRKESINKLKYKILKNNSRYLKIDEKDNIFIKIKTIFNNFA